MSTLVQMTPAQSSKKPVAPVQKEDAMWLQKEMINRNYHELATAHEKGRKVSGTFVPGNLNELLMCFDFARSLPETNALHNGMRKKTGKFILDAERDGCSEDVCTYVKADLGMMMNGDLGPTGELLPKPDILLLSYTGCFTFMKWFELVRHKYGCETVMLHVPYQSEGKITRNMVEYIVKQLKEVVIPTLERVSGVKFDIDRLRQYMKESVKAEDDLVKVLQSAKNRPSPIDGFFGAVYYVGPIFSAFRGTPEATRFYKVLRQEVEQRVRDKKGPITPAGELTEEKYRLVVEGTPCWMAFREFWKLFYDEGAVVVASTYSKVGGVYDFGFRHDPDRPLEVARRVLPRMHVEPQSAAAHRHDLQLPRRVPGRWAAREFGQELQQLFSGTAADDARNRTSYRQAFGVH